jgi:hypothetical protein
MNDVAACRVDLARYLGSDLARENNYAELQMVACPSAHAPSR